MTRPAPRSVRGNVTEETLPLAKEELELSRRKVETGRIRVTKRVRERATFIEEPLHRGEVDIERTTIERVIEQPPESRYEGDVLVIPVVEEVLVVRKQLMLKEEIRIRRRSVERPHRERVMLRSEEAVVERLEGAPLAGGGRKKSAIP